ncbi:hypothetical protein DB29_02200 [Shouchella clausii]|nr:hypothetical protein DB29_02200 [Shouchella clausii]
MLLPLFIWKVTYTRMMLLLPPMMLMERLMEFANDSFDIQKEIS